MCVNPADSEHERAESLSDSAGLGKAHKLEDHRALPLGNKTEAFNICLALWD